MAQYDLNLRDYWRILRRRWQAAAVVTLAFGVMAYIFAQVQKPDPIYQAAAVVKFERTTTLVGLLVETISVSSGDNLATQAAVVRSFPVLERAAKSLRLIPAEMDPEAVKRNPRYIQLLSDLRGQVAASPEENTTLIDITVTSPDAARATQLANAVAQAYREENLLARNRQIREARRFIEEQVAEVSGRLQQAEEGIRTLKERRGFVSLAEETTALLTRLTALESEQEKVHRVQEETATQIQALQDPQVIAGVVPPRIFTDAGDPTIAKLNTSLLDLGVERENLLVTVTPEHPQIRDLNARIATTRNNLIRELRLKLQTLQGRTAVLQRQIQQIRLEQRSLPDVARQHAQLQRDMTINENLLSMLRAKLQEVQIKEKEQTEEVSLVRPATEPSHPINPPQIFGKLAVGMLIGLLIGLVLAFVLESLDTSIGTIQDVEGYLEVPVLGLIPNIDLAKDPALAPPEDEEQDSPLGKMRPFLVSLLSPQSTIAEAYRSLRTNVEFLSLEKNIVTLCVTSASLMEGKTTTAINLAVSMAQMGKRVLLVEADLRRPFVHHAFGIPRDPGLAEVIVGNKDWRASLRTVTDLMLGPLGLEKVMAAPNIDKLHILTSGPPPPNPAEFLNSQRMTDLLAAFRQEFDIVILDCSPVLPVTDAAILSSKTDATLLVYRVGRTPRSALKRTKALLENVRGKVVGTVLTGVRAEVSPDYEELQYYRYAYRAEPGQAVSPGTAARRPHSVFRSLARPLRRPSAITKTILLIALALLLIGGLAWWFGAWPTSWLRGPALGVDKLRKALYRPSGQSRVVDQPAWEAENTPAPTPPSLQKSRESDAAVGPPLPRPKPATADPVDPARPSPPPLAAGPPWQWRPFSLQVASRQDAAPALAHAEALRRQGLEAFTVPAWIPGRGRWYRVLIGAFDSASSAAKARQGLQVQGWIGEALVRSLPYALEVAGLATEDQAADAAALLRRRGYLPVLRPHDEKVASGLGHTLLVDAFGTFEQAERLAGHLRAGGLTPRLVWR